MAPCAESPTPGLRRPSLPSRPSPGSRTIVSVGRGCCAGGSARPAPSHHSPETSECPISRPETTPPTRSRSTPRYAEGRSATRIHPELQNLRVGDQIPYSPFNAIPVVAIEPEQYLIIGNSVAWVLQDLGGGRTRLIVRTRGYRWFRSLFRRFPILRQLAVAPAQRGQEAGRVAPSPDRRRCSWVWRGGVGRPPDGRVLLGDDARPIPRPGRSRWSYRPPPRIRSRVAD